MQYTQKFTKSKLLNPFFPAVLEKNGRSWRTAYPKCTHDFQFAYIQHVLWNEHAHLNIITFIMILEIPCNPDVPQKILFYL